MCNGVSNEEIFQTTEYKKERIDDDLERNWSDTFQKDVFANEIGLETNNDGRAGGTKTTKKCEKRKIGESKENDEKLKFGEASPNEMARGTNVSDERKIRKQQRFEGESWIEGCLMFANSSIKLHSLGLVPNDGQSVLNAVKGCFVEVSRCRIEIGGEMPPFCLSGSCDLFTNISLRFPLNSHFQKCPSLFSSKPFEGVHSEKCHVLVCSSHFSSFCVSSAPFLSSPSIPLVSFSQLTFFNISTANDACSPSTTMSVQTTCLMNSCSFSSVCDAYDGGIVPSLNNPFASLTASNTSFTCCCRTRNVQFIGSKDAKQHPGRQNTTTNGANSFIWCEWNGSKTTGTNKDFSDGTSNGGAIYMFNMENGILIVTHCSFNGCAAFYAGGGVMCANIKSVEIENNSFNSCIAQISAGGGMCVVAVSSCVRISGCEFQSCKANSHGGGLDLEDINCSGTGCIDTEKEGGESACVFECGFTSCSVTGNDGGGIRCDSVPDPFKMRSIQFISCSAMGYGGGLQFHPNRATAANDNYYCYFLFFHECKCIAATPHGRDVMYYDFYSIYLSQNNSFFECYTTNTDEQRVCYGYNYTDSKGWTYQHTEKKDWLKRGILNRFVVVSGGNAEEFCGANESYACKTIGVAVEKSVIQVSLSVKLMDGNHQSETTTIKIGSKKISVIGKGRTESSIGTGALLSTGALFSVTTGNLGLLHMKVDCNSAAETSPSVVVVSDGGGSLSLEDVVITTSKTGDYVISSSLFVVLLSQLSMVDVEIKDMNVSEPLFSEPEHSSEESVLANLTIRNVKLRSGDGVVVAKSVKSEETFVVSNITIEDCECEEGNGGGMNVYLTGDGDIVVNGTSVIDGCKAGSDGGNGGRGGGLFVGIESEGCGLIIGENVEFSKVKENDASFGKDVFVYCGDGVLLESKINATSFAFFDASEIPSDVLRLSGSEDGNESGVIPLFVYLCTMGAKVLVDGGGGNGMDHNHCGFEAFRCLTVDYCANSRMSSTVNEIEVVSSSSITKEITVPSFGVLISGRITSSAGERMGVNVSDGGSDTQDWLVGCTGSLTMSRLSFVVKGQLNSRRSAFIHSTSTLSVTNCSVSFESGSLTDGKIGYNVISIEGGELIMNGFVMESGVTLAMNEKSPITISDGVKLEILNSRVSGVEVEGGNGGGCLNVEMGVNGIVNIEGCNLSSVCSGGSGMKGGGMKISVGKGGSLEMKNVKYSGCEVPREDVEDGGRGMGGGMFVKLADEMGTFVMEGMEFEGCNAWKGKNMFVSGRDLSEIVNKERFKWVIKEEVLGSLDELCGWERKTIGEGYVIPLVVYLWSNWSGNGFVSNEKGGDFSGCGFSEAPCSSIDHLISFRYPTLGEGESHINIVGAGVLNRGISFPSPPSLTETPIVTIEGEKKGTVLKVREMNGNGEGESMVVSNVIASFKNLSFTMPNELGRHSSFIQSSSSSAMLSVVSCSIDCSEERREMKYCVMRVEGGSLAIEDCTLSQFLLVKGFVEFTTDVKSVDVMNVSISNTTISESSLISLSQSSTANMLNNNAMENTKQTVKVNSSSFTNISCFDNRACVMSADSFGVGMECVMEGCVLTKCMSERSEEGGGVKVCLKSGESELKVRGCSFVMCMCSTVDGRGGGLMIDAVDPKAESVEKEMPALGVRLENIRFVMNEACVGKDVFIKCYSIAGQVNETLFVLDFSQDALKSNNSICGRDDVDKVDVDLIPFITFYYSEQVFVSVNGSESRQCGAQEKPCQSICCGVRHLEKSVANMILIDGECLIGGVCEIGDLNVKSLKRAQATIHLNTMIEEDEMNGGSVIVFVDECVVERCGFVFEEMFGWDGESIVKEKDGRLEISECRFSSATMDLVMKSRIVSVESGELKMTETTFDGIHTTAPLLSFTKEGKVSMSGIGVWDVMSECGLICVGGKVDMEMKEVNFENNSVCGNESVMKMEGAEKRMSVLNCSFARCQGTNERGRMVEICECVDVLIGSCLFDGEKEEEGDEEGKEVNEMRERDDEICRWDGSLVDITKSSVMMKDTTLLNSPEGGITMSEGNVTIEKGEFIDNNLSIEGYPSLRRNIICSDSGILNVVSVKGGDGLRDNTSLWLLNDGCSFEGIVSERDSSFFIPVLESVEAKEETDRMKLTFKGMLLVPCNLSFSVVKRKGEEKEIGHYDFDSNGFLSEREVEGSVAKDLISSCGDEIEVSVHVLFGNAESPSSTQSFILKNASETKQKDDEKIVEGGKEGKSYWLLIVIVLVVILMIVLIVAIAFIVRWRKAKNEAKDLREIVNDNIRKDPKAFEMVTMEMSPEEQWRRAEREAEKKNDERIKKRIYDTNMQHSESSEHLLSESGSTEYILGRDSDKIPEWMLEKVDDEEETRKRTPSPSISSTSTTDTSDTESTFVRSESMCPTTSSMSNLVDAMACSSPHEKLIVDLRDSLFMLLHGRNKTKEMAIGTLEEREQTAAQILFWVANLALHSFDEMEVPLQSLSSLSPHIVLFSEHMVICIVMHSDLLSSDDSDSSSISLVSMVSSSSNVSVMSERFTDSPPPSSAFEDEDCFKKECLRWKAPELLINKKMGATKESVSFSIGMMLWECLTLQIPFGEYDGEGAGQKIVNGERPALEELQANSCFETIKNCISSSVEDRPSLTQLKREFIKRFPAEMVIVTMSDAIELGESSEEKEMKKSECEKSDESGTNTNENSAQ
ncbi:uncharacterized protein MONOS_15654 [Monocercomonoides exilis]|uniref:uncharacterized protein n=1 Tax=Monocercomonoides exilis TaxID=2049356 RepID=UPI00355A5D8F|nr:hypothetical protein MONOS_15654 [Monocercomonoides exilis]|eukprot:MONOS_15654.1-p1 / transcript=MONOS_15654.1 / gene=MONOS_15654 / organism=Monocercomonoides_exilis_PA203 / gene_product=unspecified product / transcript_product=unspecified product / location=Mono_scaffold01299:447-8528(-) / protein_length=2693 / sequence_SO=supercontig / SO=protein_coding / is_pseudo=false